MNQTRISSFIEALLQVVIGYVLAFATQLVVYPAYGATFTFWQNVQIGLIFMLVSLARGYGIRRWFNARLHAAAQAMAKGLS